MAYLGVDKQIGHRVVGAKPFKSFVTINGERICAGYRVNVSGAYEAANNMLERHGWPAAVVEVFEHPKGGSWKRIDRQVLVAMEQAQH